MKRMPIARRLGITCLLGFSSAALSLCHAQVPFTDNLSLWLDAQSLSGTAGSAVTAWNDQSAGTGGSPVPSGANLTGSAGTTAPTLNLTASGLSGATKAVEFDGSNDILTSQTLTASQLVQSDKGAIFFVVRADFGPGDVSATSGQTPYGFGTNPRLFGQTLWGGDNKLHFQWGDPTAPGGDFQTSGLTTGWHIVGLVRNGTAGLIEIDGVDVAADGQAFGSGNTLPGTTSSQLTIGASLLGSDNLKGAIAEVLTYNTNLDPSQTLQVEQYLGAKYGLAPVPEPSQYAIVFGLACVGGALALRSRRQRADAAA